MFRWLLPRFVCSGKGLAPIWINRRNSSPLKLISRVRIRGNCLSSGEHGNLINERLLQKAFSVVFQNNGINLRKQLFDRLDTNVFDLLAESPSPLSVNPDNLLLAGNDSCFDNRLECRCDLEGFLTNAGFPQDLAKLRPGTVIPNQTHNIRFPPSFTPLSAHVIATPRLLHSTHH